MFAHLGMVLLGGDRVGGYWHKKMRQIGSVYHLAGGRAGGRAILLLLLTASCPEQNGPLTPTGKERKNMI
jgi:hypothetical protein